MRRKHRSCILERKEDGDRKVLEIVKKFDYLEYTIKENN